ncbi:hypothetical protein BU17DRAFT_69090 [Hysterangium stoloniferum]|nr:hypothetical protein BU17DRAFT_69090 [Hysterangium stoloniferum]
MYWILDRDNICKNVTEKARVGGSINDLREEIGFMEGLNYGKCSVKCLLLGYHVKWYNLPVVPDLHHSLSAEQSPHSITISPRKSQSASAILLNLNVWNPIRSGVTILMESSGSGEAAMRDVMVLIVIERPYVYPGWGRIETGLEGEECNKRGNSTNIIDIVYQQHPVSEESMHSQSFALEARVKVIVSQCSPNRGI